MSRAVLLPTVGDPHLLHGWLKLYEKNFKAEIDNLYVLISSDVDPAIVDYCENLVKRYGGLAFKSYTKIDHGDAIRELLEKCAEDTVCLLEEDCFILQPDKVSPEFTKIESGQFDIVGSTRGCASAAVIAKEVAVFGLSGLSPEHQIKDCPHLWPNLLFTKKQHLLNTDRDFKAKAWGPGSTIPIIDYQCLTTEASDTFVWASIQLRAAGLRFGYIHQHHAGAVDIEDQVRRRGLFVPDLPWMHFGSLSSGFAGSDLLLVDTETGLKPIGRLNSVEPGRKFPNFDPHTLTMEIARRYSILYLLANGFQIDQPGLAHYSTKYKTAVDMALNHFGIQARTGQFVAAYRELLEPMLAQTPTNLSTAQGV